MEKSERTVYSLVRRSPKSERQLAKNRHYTHRRGRKGVLSANASMRRQVRPAPCPVGMGTGLAASSYGR